MHLDGTRLNGHRLGGLVGCQGQRAVLAVAHEDECSRHGDDAAVGIADGTLARRIDGERFLAVVPDDTGPDVRITDARGIQHPSVQVQLARILVEGHLLRAVAQHVVGIQARHLDAHHLKSDGGGVDDIAGRGGLVGVVAGELAEDGSVTYVLDGHLASRLVDFGHVGVAAVPLVYRHIAGVNQRRRGERHIRLAICFLRAERQFRAALLHGDRVIALSCIVLVRLIDLGKDTGCSHSMELYGTGLLVHRSHLGPLG